jgi:Tol biopolymer transport system component
VHETRRQSAVRWTLAAVALCCVSIGVARAQDQYVLYIDGFPARKLYLAQLRGLAQDFPPRISPRAVRLPRPMGKFGNPDVSSDGGRVVFPTLFKDEWDIYTGTLDPTRREVRNVRPLVAATGVREEDPRFSWDGQEVVYKCDGSICLHPERGSRPNPVVSAEGCELYGPSFHPTGGVISYTARCGAEGLDRIRIAELSTGNVIEVPNGDGGADRYSHFLADGTLLYTHQDPQSGSESLWIYDCESGTVRLFHNRANSDADPYANKSNPEYVAFVAYRRGYDLFVYRRSREDSVRLSSRAKVLGPVIFTVAPGN